MTITTPARSRTAEQLLSLRGITKRFGAVRALSGVDLDVYAGEVVAIVGDNGAGKSTLVKILAGVHPQDGGTISFGGSPTSIPTPTDSRDLGIATVYQDLSLCDNLARVDVEVDAAERAHGAEALGDAAQREQLLRCAAPGGGGDGHAIPT